MKALHVTALVVTFVLGVAAACGGGGSDGPQEESVLLKPMEGLSGGVNSFGAAAALDVAPVGDDGSLNSYRIVQCFSLAPIPAGAEILSATYRNDQRGVVGGPYGALGHVSVQWADVGGLLGGEDFDEPGMLTSLGTLSSNATEGVKSLDVTPAVQWSVTNAEPRLDVRLMFGTLHDGDLGDDYAAFYGRAQPGDVPGIVVRYRR